LPLVLREKVLDYPHNVLYDVRITMEGEMSKCKKQESFNVRVVKGTDGVFRFDEDCYMHRWAKRGNGYLCVDASKTDRMKLRTQLQYGG